MVFRSTLDDYKRHHDSETTFPGERRSTRGLFSGSDERLVYVGQRGELRDYSYPISGRDGIERARFGLLIDNEFTWFRECELLEQRYHGPTSLAETVYSVGTQSIHQFDLTIGRAHLTRVECHGDVPDDAEVCIDCSFTPNGRETRVGQLVHDCSIEVYHNAEHDFLATDPAYTRTSTLFTDPLEPLVGSDPDLPMSTDDFPFDNYRLGGDVLVAVPFEDTEPPQATIASVLTDTNTLPRTRARSLAERTVRTYTTLETLREAALRQAQDRPYVDGPFGSTVLADLRVLSLLAAKNGARIAGPDFDPLYAHSGGYGYTWFRDDAEIARCLLESHSSFDRSLEQWHANSAAFYRRTQRSNGSWPHRVWASDGSLAPGWANGPLEASGDSHSYQADQTGSVAAFLATYLRVGDPTPRTVASTTATLVDAIEFLDSELASDGLPRPCRNCWEDTTGRFTHTAGTFLHAFAATARAPVGDAVSHRATERASTVYDALDDCWSDERGAYTSGRIDGTLDDHLDSSTFALVDAHREYAALAGPIDELRLERLVSHVETTLDGLYRDSDDGDVAGLCRYEGDQWRRRTQSHEKIWTVATAWGANAAATLSELLAERGHDRAPEFERRGRKLLALLLPNGPLSGPNGYLPEQVFDDGTPDSATPLGWSHALRLATVVRLYY